MTHGHELKAGNVSGRGFAGQRGIKRRKWDNCNSIITKMFKKKSKVKIIMPLSRQVLKMHIFEKRQNNSSFLLF